MSLTKEASAEPPSEQKSVPLKVARLSGGSSHTSPKDDLTVDGLTQASKVIDHTKQKHTSAPADSPVTSNVEDTINASPTDGDDSKKSEDFSRSDFSLVETTADNPHEQDVAKESDQINTMEEHPTQEKAVEVASLPMKQESPNLTQNTDEGLSTSSSEKTQTKVVQSNTTDLKGTATKILTSKQESASLQSTRSQNISPLTGSDDVMLTADQRLVKARLLIEQNDHAEAIRVLHPLFASPPSSWEPWFWMGTAQLGIGELDKAEEAFMEGLVRDDSVGYLWVQRAVVAQQRGHYGKAMDALRQAELIAPDLPEVHLNLAYNLEYQGNVRLAHRHYRQYLSLTEGQSTYHTVRRKVLERVLRLSRS